MPILQRFCLILLLLSLFHDVFAFPPERRRSYDDRSPNEYLFIPAVASLPGIGVFVGIVSSFSNIADTGIDAALSTADSIDSSDIKVRVGAVRNLPLFIPGLTLEYWFGDIKFQDYQYYLPGRNSPNYTIPVTGQILFQQLRPNLRLWERRINVQYTLSFSGGFGVDEDGNEVEQNNHSANGQIFLDFTDDFTDPRIGIRLRYQRSLTPPKSSIFGKDSDSSSIFKQDEEVTTESWQFSYFIPTSERWVIAGDIQYAEANGREDSDDIVVGGSPPLRGYPGNRWSDRYSFYTTIEPRYTIPLNYYLDIYVVQGKVDGLQFATFYEVGQVSPDLHDEPLLDDLHHSYGFGIRLLLEAIVLRFDYALSDEGSETTLTIDQPF